MARDATTTLATGSSKRNVDWEIRGTDLSAVPTHIAETAGVCGSVVGRGDDFVFVDLKPLVDLASEVAYFAGGQDDSFNANNWGPLVSIEGDGDDKTVVVTNVVTPAKQEQMARIEQP